MKRLLFLPAITASMLAQTTVYLRDSAPAAVPIYDVSNTTPVVVETRRPPSFSPGDTVIIAGTCTGAGPSTANGVRRVKAVIDSTHFSITDLTGVDIPASGGPCDWAGQAQGAMWTGKATPYTLGPGPLGFLDGLNGPIFRKLALGTQNGLTSLVVSGNVATIATSYANGMSTGDKVGIWGTTASSLNKNGGAYTVTVVDATHFTFPTTGVPNGDYTHNDACGPASPPNGTIGGTQNCVRVSQLAYAGNPQWDSLLTQSAGYNSGTGYKVTFDGGGSYPGSTGLPAVLAYAVPRFLVDQTNSQMLSVVLYGLNHLERVEGVNWYVNGFAGNVLNVQWDYTIWAGIGLLWDAGGAYLSPAEKKTALDKLWNDMDDPTVAPCSTADADMSSGHNPILATGTAQAGSPTTITLAASDSKPDGYYVNNVVAVSVPDGTSYGLVTAYSSATKIATVASWSYGPAATGKAYTIYGTITMTGSPNSTGTVVGYNTHFTTDMTVGDALMGANWWTGYPEANQMYVSAIADDTHLTVINSFMPSASSTPSVAWYMPKWKTGDCGFIWQEKHWQGSVGAQSPLYYGGGTLTDNAPYGPAEGANNTSVLSHMAGDFAMAADEPRAVRDLATQQSMAFDYEIRHYMNYKGGAGHSGGLYDFISAGYIPNQAATVLASSVPSFPSMDLTGPWMNDFALYKIFNVYPDFRYYIDGAPFHIGWPLRVGTDTGANMLIYYQGSAWVYAADPIFQWSPNSANAKYLRDWLENSPNFPSLWANPASQVVVQNLFQLDPRIGRLDYTTQPHQYAFTRSSSARCAELTGWPCPDAFKGALVISRTGLSSFTDTLMYAGFRTFWSDHDTQENGTLRLYKVGELLFPDSSPPGSVPGEPGGDETTLGDVMQFGGVAFGNLKAGAGVNSAANSPVTRWASANHGAWDTAYGDQNSKYAYTCGDLSPAYTISFNYANRCFAHFKKAGKDEFLMQWDSVSLPAATQIATHVHYTQNGEVGVSAYDEGHTTCPGGCTSLNTGRVVQSLQSGVRDAVGDPTPQYGVITNFLTPGTVRWDCPGGGECNPSSTYSGGYGHTDRVSICAGACGSAQTSFRSLIVHKIAQQLSDTSLTTAALNPDGNWTGVQACGVVSCAVYLETSGGTTRSTMTGFVTSHAGSAQYLFGGLAPGTYAVTVNGVAVSGSPFTVSAGDNSLEFESTAGTISVNGSATPVTSGSPSVSGSAKTNGSVVIH